MKLTYQRLTYPRSNKDQVVMNYKKAQESWPDPIVTWKL